MQSVMEFKANLPKGDQGNSKPIIHGFLEIKIYVTGGKKQTTK